MPINRRIFLKNATVAATALSFGRKGFGSVLSQSYSYNKLPSKNLSSVSVFSKNLHWLSINEMAKAVAEMGFDGIDLTVRPNGHILPENVTEEIEK